MKKRGKLDAGQRFLRSQGMLNRLGLPKASLFILWLDGEPLLSTKDEDVAMRWDAQGRLFFAQVIRPLRKNPSGRSL